MGIVESVGNLVHFIRLLDFFSGLLGRRIFGRRLFGWRHFGPFQAVQIGVEALVVRAEGTRLAEWGTGQAGATSFTHDLRVDRFLALLLHLQSRTAGVRGVLRPVWRSHGTGLALELGSGSADAQIDGGTVAGLLLDSGEGAESGLHQRGRVRLLLVHLERDQL